MRWHYESKRTPEFGERRLIHKFAFFPIVCNNDHKHWLEFVVIRQWRGTTCWWNEAYTKCICPDSEEVKQYFKKEDTQR